MKTIKGIAMLLLATTMFVSCKQTSNEQKENNTDSLTNTEKVTSAETAGVMQKATFQVEGMSCAVGCAKVIEGKLAKMDGVKEAKVDFESKTATVEFDDAKQNPDAIKKMVEEIAKGAYKVQNMQVAKELAMVDQEEKKADKKCCSSHKDGKSSCDDKKSKDTKKDGCCSKDKKTKTTTTKNII
ncbi:heavy-metal-associated domain-containing protein [Flavobacterium sp. xlx-214]|uniref:heavy-metal-associated domain-containing protein n=1 Tax=unclassified Flavobacterium TaxID=196869 RepID=UPI0013D440FF|nr:MULTISPECIES: cation transporter [unclassified Flavobacterium]MBA5793889.1 heavy-metal-associated domain-containing protein [Flavobacterium sp. xlx-221]QMI84810.1 heavy-metal-associated domain-containing protein [Flavobacterium sp. xlx-214]